MFEKPEGTVIQSVEKVYEQELRDVFKQEFEKVRPGYYLYPAELVVKDLFNTAYLVGKNKNYEALSYAFSFADLPTAKIAIKDLAKQILLTLGKDNYLGIRKDLTVESTEGSLTAYCRLAIIPKDEVPQVVLNSLMNRYM